MLPTLLIGGVSYVIVMQWLGKFRNRDGTALSYGELSLAIACSAAALAWPVWWAKRLKRVEVDDRALYVSNYITEVRIPLSEVTVVRESGSRRHFTLSIDLRNPSAFGKRIVFRPQFRLYWSGIHPVVRELQALCKQARDERGERS